MAGRECSNYKYQKDELKKTASQWCEKDTGMSFLDKVKCIFDDILDSPVRERSGDLGPEELEDLNDAFEKLGKIFKYTAAESEPTSHNETFYSSQEDFEEVVHTDTEFDVDLFERKYSSLSKGEKYYDPSVDIFVDLNCDASGKASMTLVEDCRTGENHLSVVDKNDNLVDKNDYVDVDIQETCENLFDNIVNESSISDSGENLSMMSMASSVIRRELIKLGDNVGPITPSTRRTYLVRLKKLREHQEPQRSSPCLDPRSLHDLDFEMGKKFTELNSEAKQAVHLLTRDGGLRSSFNYLLLDPRITKNLPMNHVIMTEQESWEIFLSSVFYIGKGTRSRPFDHLYEAVRKFSQFGNGSMKRLSKKTKRILEIWSCELGVICLQVFQNSYSVEALTREAAMIDALGLLKLTNEKRGDYYGEAASWTREKKLSFGSALLFRAFKIFLFEGERQLGPLDLKKKK